MSLRSIEGRVAMAAAAGLLLAASVAGRVSAQESAGPGMIAGPDCLIPGHYGMTTAKFGEPRKYPVDVTFRTPVDVRRFAAGEAIDPQVVDLTGVPLTEPATLSLHRSSGLPQAPAEPTEEQWRESAMMELVVPANCPPNLQAPIINAEQSPSVSPRSSGGDFLTTCGVEVKTGEATTKIEYFPGQAVDTVVGSYSVNAQGQVTFEDERSFTAESIASGEPIKIREGVNRGAAELRIRAVRGTLNTGMLRSPSQSKVSDLTNMDLGVCYITP